MGTVRKTITFTEQQDKWIKSQVATGDFTNDSEYLRYLIRTDQARHDHDSKLRSAIEMGMKSGISDKSVPDIMKEVEDSMRKDGRL